MSRLAPLAALLLCLSAPASRADWPADPAVNVPLSLAVGEKYDVFTVSDGAGGAIVAWEDERGGDRDVYARRIDVNGDPLWTSDGVAVCAAAGDQHLYHSSTGTTGFRPLLADGEGGAWLAWQDSRTFGATGRDIYLQRLDADGQPHFAANGLLVADGPGFEDMPTLCPDGAGGVVIVWQDKNDDPIFYNLYGQRVSGSGELLWNGGAGLPLVVMDWDQDGPTLCADGVGGAYLAWTDSRDNLNDVYALRIDAAGQPLWTENGIAVATSASGQDAIAIRPAEGGGAILAWVDRRSGDSDIYAQKLSPMGSALWGAGGLRICGAANSQYRPALCTDAAGGAIVAWYDFRVATGAPWDLNIYAQRVLADGTPAWLADGEPVCVAPDAQRDADLCADGAGGAYIVWEDNRGGAGHEDVYAQRVDAAGNRLLLQDGVALSTAANNQQRPSLVRGAGGIVAAWYDDREVIYQPDVYGDRLLSAPGAWPAVNRLLFDLRGSGAVSRDFAVSNVGAAAVTIEAVALDAPSTALSLTVGAMLPRTLQPGERFDVTVHYAPSAPTREEHAVLVHHDAPEPASPLSVIILHDGVITAAPTAVARAGALAAHPNPFNPQGELSFELFQDGPVRLDIFATNGRRLRTLRSGQRLAAGRHRVSWDGQDDAGRAMPSGVYLARLAAGERREAQKLVLLR